MRSATSKTHWLLTRKRWPSGRRLADANPTDHKFQTRSRGELHRHGSHAERHRKIGRGVDTPTRHRCRSCKRSRHADHRHHQGPERPGGQSHQHRTLLSATGRLAEALKAHESALAIRQRLADDNPNVNEFQMDLAGSHNNIGGILRQTGKLTEALKAFDSSLTIRQKLADANPTVNQYPERPGAQPRQHRHRAAGLRQAGRGAEDPRVGAGDPPEAGRRQPHRHRVPK